ncbi:MAG: SDR family NAD(P)-dependent oxidoreductase [Pseudomonadota bacterium]
MESGQRLHQMRAVVTGAATGIGDAIARVYAQNGAEVLTEDLPDSGIDRMYQNVSNIDGHICDVSTDAAPEEILELVGKTIGGVDILVNNAGISKVALVEKSPDEVWDTVMANNLRPVFRLSRALLPLIKRSPAGRIINLGSIFSSFGAEGMSAYVASKHAIAGLTKSLASEVGRFGITCNYIQPGAIMTDMTREPFRQQPEARDLWIKRSAAGRLGEPLDVAKVALFLATDDAAFVSGTGIVVDGGAVQSV